MAEIVRLSQKQRAAVKALMTAPTLADAAKAAGCSERQLYRWMALPGFVAELAKHEADALGTVSRRLTVLSNDAVTVLAAALQKGTEVRPVNLRAALGVLDRLIGLREFVTIEARLTAIEQVLKGGAK